MNRPRPPLPGPRAIAAPSARPPVFHLETTSAHFLLRTAERWLPAPVFSLVLQLGVWVAVIIFREPRRHSRSYLTAILGRPPSWREIRRHFLTFAQMHLLRLVVTEGREHHCRSLPDCRDFTALMESGRPALLGSFHVGNSDLLGFFLGRYRRRVQMVRYRLGDPANLRQLAAQRNAGVTFIWVNEKENLLFALKQAVESGESIAMKCDRVGYSAKLEAFVFLGVPRWFPFTIYHLGIMFQRPVTFCVSVPAEPGHSEVHGFPVFEPDAGTKEENLDRARAHFQLVLRGVEALLRTNPYLWFNFTPLNPEASPGNSTARPWPPAERSGADSNPGGTKFNEDARKARTSHGVG